MNLKLRPVRKSDGSLIFKANNEITQRFEETQRINAQTMQAAQQRVDALRLEYTAEISQKIEELYHTFLEYKARSQDAHLPVILKHNILDMKSTAGMFGFPVITLLCELMFELFDKDYDLNNFKVRKSIDLYIQTLYTVWTRDLRDSSSQYASELLEELSSLNTSLEKQ